MSAPAQYEFSETENRVLSRLSGWMRFVGWALIALSILQFLSIGGMLHHLFGMAAYRRSGNSDLFVGSNMLAGVLFSVVYFLIGMWTVRAAGALRQVVETYGQDISHFLHALGQLRSAFSLMYWCLVVTLGFVVLWFVASMLGLS